MKELSTGVVQGVRTFGPNGQLWAGHLDCQVADLGGDAQLKVRGSCRNECPGLQQFHTNLVTI